MAKKKPAKRGAVKKPSKTGKRRSRKIGMVGGAPRGRTTRRPRNG